MGSGDAASSRLQEDFKVYRQTILKGDAAAAIIQSASILERSRSKDERDPVIEAMIRMERALHGANESSLVGAELRWCTDRMNALAPGSANHGICLLNLAASNRDRPRTCIGCPLDDEISE